MSLTKNTLLIGALVGAVLATHIAAAAEGACLQRNRLVSWRAVDESTLEMTDRTMNKYTVQLRSRCFQATRPGARLGYRYWTELGCLKSGEVISVFAPGGGRATCVVSGIQTAADAPAPAN
jgi:hypothetical protein